MAGKKGQKKRFWSDEEKGSICEQTRAPGVSVAQIARRYAMNANLIHKWLRDPRFAPDCAEVAAAEEATTFLPIEIEGMAISPSTQTCPSLYRPWAHHLAPTEWTSRCLTGGAFWWRARRCGSACKIDPYIGVIGVQK